YIEESIRKNKIFEDYQENIKNKGYEVDIYVSPISKRDILEFKEEKFDFEKYDMQFYLNCKKGRTDILTLDNIDEDFDIANLCKIMVGKFDPQLLDKKSIHQLDEFNKLTNELDSAY